MKKLTEFYVKATQQLNNERGAQSLEWLGIAALLILVLGIVSSAISDQSDGIGKIISDIITKISNMVG
ncbi:hypothetical protein MUN88_06515 [Gracilibacillus caseinilyticus]|uniref:Flagellin, Flp1-like, domain n=1 Tax=Gracilibacillus caseinilyticus TaxID=2932256 RepID=A0ABY4F0W4_9BACI|nr:hypothetical protein [Gracilibacillus caseinilyticus]UOQ49727.1 hypothetical protein MUN88_06515 [Gracilibacillus caseinilyticus]